MKKKITHCSILFILIAIVLFWRICLTGSGFYEWGIFFFSVPIIYLFASCITKTNEPSLKIIIPSFIGVIIVFLLSRDFINSYLLQKIGVTFLGSVLVYLLPRRKT